MAVDKTETTIDLVALEVATRAVYDCPMSDGDTVAEIIHNSDYIDASVPIEAQLNQVLDICRLIATTVIKTYQDQCR
jgi:hypothetical protein